MIDTSAPGWLADASPEALQQVIERIRETDGFESPPLPPMLPPPSPKRRRLLRGPRKPSGARGQANLEQRLLALLADGPRSKSVLFLARGVHSFIWDWTARQAALDALLARGLVEAVTVRVSAGVRPSRPVVHYRLARRAERSA